MMMRHFIPLAAFALALPVAASAQDWNHAKRIEIDMANFKFMPDRIVLHHGETYVLHFVNQARGGHNFVAKNFFSSVQVAPADKGKVANGEVELGGGETMDVRLVAPAAGAAYEAHCSHFMHQTFGMKGEIVVQ